MRYSDGGKGSSRRQEDVSKINENWDRIFETKKQELPMEYEEHADKDAHASEEEWVCDSCGGPMYRQTHWNYGQCDDCGARQELEDDSY
ncbi:hypothetical protein UFOVP176_45 [uncultured Caudovirales phage]|uniref:Uncharacterized protein n=1 Tax=uncultured Caudovirales phage TaxID=2100421 RepID=A0A6J7WGV9_9CAUD|nr:hypothetical protein UFOVP176_45 [uncultured Caudovirales phage]